MKKIDLNQIKNLNKFKKKGNKMSLVWSNDYSVGLEEIDSQHKKLIVLINRLEFINSMNPEREEFQKQLRNTLEELTNYTVLHFATEEVLMRMFEYPGFDKHKLGHDNFVNLVLNKTSEIENLLKDKNYVAVKEDVNEVYEFLKNWLLGHIKKSDFEYSAFFLKIQKKAKEKGGFFSFFK